MQTSRMLGLATALAIIASAFAANPLAAAGVVVPDGTEVKLRLTQSLSSATAVENEPLLFEVVETVTVDGMTVIEKGAQARGTVTWAQHRKGFGRRGKLEFSIDVVKGADGRNVPLRATRSLRGKDLYGTAGVVTILTGPVGVFVEGRDVVVPAGTEYLVYVNDK